VDSAEAAFCVANDVEGGCEGDLVVRVGWIAAANLDSVADVAAARAGSGAIMARSRANGEVITAAVVERAPPLERMSAPTSAADVVAAASRQGERAFGAHSLAAHQGMLGYYSVGTDVGALGPESRERVGNWDAGKGR